MSLTLKPSDTLKDFKVISSVHNIILKCRIGKIFLEVYSKLKYLIVFVHNKCLNVPNVFIFNGFPCPDEMNCFRQIVRSI